MFNGKVVPYFTRWNESRGMSSSILKYVFETIDYRHLSPFSSGVVPFVMRDGHGSWLELPFLKYINDSKTE